MHTEVDELDRPYTLATLAAKLRERGECVSAATLWRWVRLGKLPHAKVGRTTSTLRSFYAARTPRIAAR
jgi:hypothetical protein